MSVKNPKYLHWEFSVSNDSNFVSTIFGLDITDDVAFIDWNLPVSFLFTES